MKRNVNSGEILAAPRALRRGSRLPRSGLRRARAPPNPEHRRFVSLVVDRPARALSWITVRRNKWVRSFLRGRKKRNGARLNARAAAPIRAPFFNAVLITLH